MTLISNGVISMSAQLFLLLSLVCTWALAGKIPQGVSDVPQSAKINTGVSSAGTNPSAAMTSVRMPLVSDDLEVVAHTGGADGPRQKRYIGWGKKPSLRYNKAVSVIDHDSLFNRLYNNFDKRAGPEAPISSFRELRMKQKVPNIQLLLPHLQMRNARIPSADVDDGAATLSELDRQTGGKLTQEDLEALAYLLEGDMP